MILEVERALLATPKHPSADRAREDASSRVIGMFTRAAAVPEQAMKPGSGPRDHPPERTQHDR